MKKYVLPILAALVVVFTACENQKTKAIDYNNELVYYVDNADSLLTIAIDIIVDTNASALETMDNDIEKIKKEFAQLKDQFSTLTKIDDGGFYDVAASILDEYNKIFDNEVMQLVDLSKKVLEMEQKEMSEEEYNVYDSLVSVQNKIIDMLEAKRQSFLQQFDNAQEGFYKKYKLNEQ